MTEEYRNMIRNSVDAFMKLKDGIENAGWEQRVVISTADAKNTILQFYIESFAQA